MKNILAIAMVGLLLIGCGKRDESVANQAGEAIGKQITDFTKGVGKGIDQKMTVAVALRPDAAALGLTNTIAKSLGLDAKKKGISVYFIASQNVSNTVVVRALNAEGTEIGRARKLVVLEKADAKYVPFEFDEEMDTAMVKKYEIGL